MSGFVAVICLRPNSPSVREETRALALVYANLRGGANRYEVAGDGRLAYAVAFGADVTEDGRGWTIRQGQPHGRWQNPLTAAGFAALDGQFCAVSHTAATGRSLLATDRFAAAPVYFAQSDGRLFVSTSAMALARHLKVAASVDGLRNFLVSGYQFGPETHWQNVRRLDPGVLVEVGEGRHVYHSYWQPRPDEAVEEMDLDAAATHLIDVSIETLRSRLGGQQTWLDLTGGYDSRLLALLLHEAGVPFTGNTRESHGPDLDMARELARQRGWPWHAITYPNDWPSRLPKVARAALAAADGRLEMIQLSRVKWAHGQLATSIPRLLSAGGGEHLQWAAWKILKIPGVKRARPNIPLWVDMQGLRPADLSVLANGSRNATRAAYIDRLSAWSNRFEGEPVTRQLDAVFAYKSSGHFGAYRAADDLDLVAQLPYFFEPIFTAAFSIDARHRNGFRLMRLMMERLDSKIAALATTRGGPALPMRLSTFHRYLPHYGTLGRKGINKAWGQVTGQALFPWAQNYPWPEEESNAALVNQLQSAGQLNWSDMRIRPLLSEVGVRRLRGGEVSNPMLGRVLTAEMALRLTGTGL